MILIDFLCFGDIYRDIYILKSVEIHTGSFQVSKTHPHDFAHSESSSMHFLTFSMISMISYVLEIYIYMDVYENLLKYAQEVSE